MIGQIWIVEDDDDDQEFYRDCLTKLSPYIEIVFFSSADRVLQQLNTDEAILPQLMIVDGHLPPMGGLELIRRLQVHPRSKTTPIVMITGTLSAAEMQNVTAFDIPVYTKPYTISRWFDMLQGIVSCTFIFCCLN